MNKYQVGVLKRGDAVLVNGSTGVVCSVHEPEWIDHRTGCQMIEFQGADIRVDGQNRYYHADKIEMQE